MLDASKQEDFLPFTRLSTAGKEVWGLLSTEIQDVQQIKEFTLLLPNIELHEADLSYKLFDAARDLFLQ